MCAENTPAAEGSDLGRCIEHRKLAIDLLKISENNYVGFRSDELNKIQDFLTQCIKEVKGGSMFVFGLSGTGKTTVLEHVLADVKRSHKRVRTVTLRGSTFISLKAFKNEFFQKVLRLNSARASRILNLSSNGRVEDYSKFSDLLIKHFNSPSFVRICLIDEVDYLSSFCSNLRGCERSNWLLQSLFKAASSPTSKVVVLAVSNNLHFAGKIRDGLCVKVLFRPYTEAQMVSIMLGKLKALNLHDVMDRSSVLVLARRIANTSGDCRAFLDSFVRALTNSLSSLEKLSSLESLDTCSGPDSTNTTNTSISSNSTIINSNSSNDDEMRTPKRVFNEKDLSRYNVGAKEIGIVTPTLSLSKRDQLRQQLCGLPNFQLILLLAICKCSIIQDVIVYDDIKKYFLEFAEKLRMDSGEAESFCNSEFGSSLENFRQLSLISKKVGNLNSEMLLKTDPVNLSRVVLESSCLDLEMADLEDPNLALTKRYSSLAKSFNFATTTPTNPTSTNLLLAVGRGSKTGTTTSSSSGGGGGGSKGNRRNRNRLWWCR